MNKLNTKIFIIKKLSELKNFFSAKKECFCPFCKRENYFLPFGVISRKKAMCPICGSLERHRFLYSIYKKYFLNTDKPVDVLHMAPERCIYDLIKENEHISYTAIDLSPQNYSFAQNCLKQDVLNLSFNDDSFDYVISNHVLEHLSDEKKFFEEISRVLKPDGICFLTFPVNPNYVKTFEDDKIVTDEDRLKHYGQKDHFRVYGADFRQRLKQYANFEFIKCANLLSMQDIKKMNCVKSDFCCVVKNK